MGGYSVVKKTRVLKDARQVAETLNAAKTP